MLPSAMLPDGENLGIRTIRTQWQLLPTGRDAPVLMVVTANGCIIECSRLIRALRFGHVGRGPTSLPLRKEKLCLLNRQLISRLFFLWSLSLSPLALFSQ